VAFSLGTAFIIVIVNFLLKIVLKALGSFSRYKTITEEVSGTMFKLFYALFTNTALIALILQADIFGFAPAELLVENILTFLDNNNASYYVDFSREWYTVVGNKITIAVLLLMISPHSSTVMMLPCFRCSRASKAKKAVL